MPLPAATVAILRDYLTRPSDRRDGADPRFNPSVVPLPARTDARRVHPRAGDPDAPLFPSVRLIAGRPTGKCAPRHETGPRAGKPMPPEEQAARRTVEEAQARLELDWNAVLLHKTYYKAVFQPALLRATLALVTDALRPIQRTPPPTAAGTPTRASASARGCTRSRSPTTRAMPP